MLSFLRRLVPVMLIFFRRLVPLMLSFCLVDSVLDLLI